MALEIMRMIWIEDVYKRQSKTDNYKMSTNIFFTFIPVSYFLICRYIEAKF